MTSLRNTCPHMKITHTFHHFSLACTAYPAIIPCFYLWNYLKHKKWAENGRTFENNASASRAN
jgi:hypothetical protein